MNIFPESPQESGRLDYLDSIRGIAALLVVLCHCWQITPTAFQNEHKDAAAALDSFRNFMLYAFARLPDMGRSSVMVFFVLSGFVLALSLMKRPTSYGGFVVKRAFRIYPAFAVAVLASYALHSSIGIAHKVTSIWLAYEMTPDLSGIMLAKNLALWSTTGANGLDRVMWSLVHEMRISLIFPLLLLTVNRFRGRAVLAYGVLSAACSLWLLQLTGQAAMGYEEKTFGLTFLDTGYYVVFFAAGAWLAVERERVAEKIACMPAWMLAFLALLAAYGLVREEFDLHAAPGLLNDYLRGTGAFIIIAFALGRRRLENILSHRALIWLGRISYSLYLVHCPVLYAVNQTFGWAWPVPMQTAAIVILSMLIAEMLAVLVEFPLMRLGRRMAG